MYMYILTPSYKHVDPKNIVNGKYQKHIIYMYTHIHKKVLKRCAGPTYTMDY